MRRIESQLDYATWLTRPRSIALKSLLALKRSSPKGLSVFRTLILMTWLTEIHDGVRYTFILDFDHYTDGVGLAQSKLAEAGL